MSSNSCIWQEARQGSETLMWMSLLAEFHDRDPLGVLTRKCSIMTTAAKTKLLIYLASKSLSPFRIHGHELPEAFPGVLVVRWDISR